MSKRKNKKPVGEFELWGQVGDPNIKKETYGNVNLVSVEFERGPERLGEVTIETRDPNALRSLAEFLLEQADDMEQMGEDYCHAHYRSAEYPDLIVFRKRD